ncbi:MAG: SlyX family protein [Planctomycetaceae bacterium]
MSAPDSESRIVAIESLLMQLQYDVEQLSSALRAQQAELQELQRGLHRVSAAVAEQSQEPVGPAHDPPPHY